MDGPQARAQWEAVYRIVLHVHPDVAALG